MEKGESSPLSEWFRSRVSLARCAHASQRRSSLRPSSLARPLRISVARWTGGSQVTTCPEVGLCRGSFKIWRTGTPRMGRKSKWERARVAMRATTSGSFVLVWKAAWSCQRRATGPGAPRWMASMSSANFTRSSVERRAQHPMSTRPMLLLSSTRQFPAWGSAVKTPAWKISRPTVSTIRSHTSRASNGVRGASWFLRRPQGTSLRRRTATRCSSVRLDRTKSNARNDDTKNETKGAAFFHDDCSRCHHRVAL
mmetsp:Transcript_24318/g.78562  ORF Transcript_24318/g.78562 Transcript_24318/m.78562 type:complete len:253 (+) Transcript_24318:208-966(+)